MSTPWTNFQMVTALPSVGSVDNPPLFGLYAGLVATVTMVTSTTGTTGGDTSASSASTTGSAPTPTSASSGVGSASSSASAGGTPTSASAGGTGSASANALSSGGQGAGTLATITAYVPQVLGLATTNQAPPLGIPYEGEPPAVGDPVYIMFIGGDRNRPVYIPPVWALPDYEELYKGSDYWVYAGQTGGSGPTASTTGGSSTGTGATGQSGTGTS
jgi:hypothetical protein